MEKLRYPTGRFEMPDSFDRSELKDWIAEIKAFPKAFEEMALSLSDAQLEQTYRPDGWTGRQVIHHVADSHVNAYIRFKWTLTEDTPSIKAYDEAAWANLPDSRLGSIDAPLSFLKGLHHRWGMLMDMMDQSDFNKSYFHPDNEKYYHLGGVCKLYAWHGKHHLAHLTIIKNEMA